MAKNNKIIAYIFFILLVLTIAAFMLVQVETDKQNQKALSEQKVLQEAKAYFDSIVITRSWNAIHNGIYVKQTDKIRPNPYLKDNSLLTKAGETLVKINPAWMTRQISELTEKKNLYYFTITSLNPLNPNNKPDVFEQKALEFFKINPDKKHYSQFNDDHLRFNFMGSLVTEQSCLNCHQHQGYKLGDIRGGIRVSLPTPLFNKEQQMLTARTNKAKISIIAAAVFILLLLLVFFNIIYRQQQKVEKLNVSLAEKVKDRTKQLEKMYQHEKYIKEILKTIADVNELLLSSMSMQTVFQSCTKRLLTNQHYRFIWIGLIKNDQLEVAYKSEDNPSVIDQESYSLSDDNTKNNFAISAIRKNQTLIEKYPSSHVHKVRRKEDYILQWVISIPFTTNNIDVAHGVLNIYSDREQGFEPEEINVLENFVQDISLVLESQKQKEIMAQMEVEKISNYKETILAFVNIIEQRDTYTAGHSLRVAEYSKQIALALNIDETEVRKLEKAAILHDIGKVATPDSVLLKPGKLNNLEYDLIKQHAAAGFNMLSKVAMYKDLAEIIKYHHAHYDGNGYPVTSSPDSIPFLSHIMTVADAFDAMTSNRIYKPRKLIEDALCEIKAYSGTQFHPVVVEAAVKVLKEINIPITTQLPNTVLEQKRFSYFFCDALTELYNENYLQLTLADTQRKQNCLHLILLKNFSGYNRKNGWNKGNEVLIQLSKVLIKTFPNASVFRYHGDDFVILFDQHEHVDKTLFDTIGSLDKKGISIVTKYIDLKPIMYDIDSFCDYID